MQETSPRNLARSVNPATGEVLAEYPLASAAQIDSLLDQSYAAFGQWKRRTPEQRGAVLRQIAARLRQQGHLLYGDLRHRSRQA